jgi:hypothetical protein
MPRRQSRRRRSLVFGACAVMWLFGLNDPDLSSLHLLVFTVAGLLTLVFAGALRLRAEHARARDMHALGRLPQASLVVRRLSAPGGTSHR